MDVQRACTHAWTKVTATRSSSSHMHIEMCTHHTLHQGGSQKLLPFFSLSEHVVSFFFSSVLLVSFTFLSSSSSSPSLSPLSPLLFRSSSVAGGENPGDTRAQAHERERTHSSGRHFDNALRCSWVQSSAHTRTPSRQRAYAYTQLSSSTVLTPPCTHAQLVYLQLDGDRGIASFCVNGEMR